MREHFVDGPVISALESGIHKLCREWRYLILQLGEFIRDIGRQQIAACRQQLAEFNEDRTQCFEGLPQALGPRRRELAPEQQVFNEPAQSTHAFMAEEEFIEPETQAHRNDFDQAEKTHPRIVTATGGRRELSGGRAPRAATLTRSFIKLARSVLLQPLLEALFEPRDVISQCVDFAHEAINVAFCRNEQALIGPVSGYRFGEIARAVALPAP